MNTLMFFPFAFALLMACTKSEVPVNESSVTPKVNKTVLLQLVNALRSKGCNCGDDYYGPVPAVTWNVQLETAAYNHSNDMFINKYFSHTSPSGSSSGERIRNAGYSWSAFGENIAVRYADEKSVIEGWLESPGHCSNIMDKSSKEMGVAKVGSYWTQVLATK
jgi:uncharacterized protein YkwD